MKIGKTIKEARKEKGFTQQQLAEKLEISHAAVAKWESGKSKPGTDKLMELSNILGLPLQSLVSEEDTKTAPAMYPKHNLHSRTAEEIPFYGVSANAGLPAPNLKQDEEVHILTIPKLPYDMLAAFEVNGESMMPVLHPGDIVIANQLMRGESLLPNVIYVIITQDDEILIKYITVMSDHLICHAADRDAYEDVRINLDNVDKIFHFRLRMTAHVGRPFDGHQRTRRLERFFDKKFPGWEGSE